MYTFYIYIYMYTLNICICTYMYIHICTYMGETKMKFSNLSALMWNSSRTILRKSLKTRILRNDTATSELDLVNATYRIFLIIIERSLLCSSQKISSLFLICGCKNKNCFHVQPFDQPYDASINICQVVFSGQVSNSYPLPSLV